MSGDKKLVLPPSVELAIALEKRDAQTEAVVNVMTCGLCQNNSWHITEAGVVICSRCKEMASGALVQFSGPPPEEVN